MKKSGDRSDNITAVAACSATSTIVLPSMPVSEGVTLNEGLMNEARLD
jgi:hypothetical protein